MWCDVRGSLDGAALAGTRTAPSTPASTREESAEASILTLYKLQITNRETENGRRSYTSAVAMERTPPTSSRNGLSQLWGLLAAAMAIGTGMIRSPTASCLALMLPNANRTLSTTTSDNTSIMLPSMLRVYCLRAHMAVARNLWRPNARPTGSARPSPMPVTTRGMRMNDGLSRISSRMMAHGSMTAYTNTFWVTAHMRGSGRSSRRSKLAYAYCNRVMWGSVRMPYNMGMNAMNAAQKVSAYVVTVLVNGNRAKRPNGRKNEKKCATLRVYEMLTSARRCMA